MAKSDDLARRAVSCAGWRWMPGMLTLHGRICGFGYLVSQKIDEAGQLFIDCTDTIEDRPSLLPDLTDPATLGCLLAMVREAWGDPAMSVTAGYTKDRKVEWEVEHPHPDSLPEALWTYFDTEAAALVAALEAAP